MDCNIFMCIRILWIGLKSLCLYLVDPFWPQIIESKKWAALKIFLEYIVEHVYVVTQLRGDKI